MNILTGIRFTACPSSLLAATGPFKKALSRSARWGILYAACNVKPVLIPNGAKAGRGGLVKPGVAVAEPFGGGNEADDAGMLSQQAYSCTNDSFLNFTMGPPWAAICS